MDEDEHGQPLAEWEQKQESERKEWDSLWERHKMTYEDLQEIKAEMQHDAD